MISDEELAKWEVMAKADTEEFDYQSGHIALALLEELREIRAVEKWVLVSEALPEEGVGLLIIVTHHITDKPVVTCGSLNARGDWNAAGCIGPVSSVTHWREFPVPPKTLT